MIITVANLANRKIKLQRKQKLCTMILFKNEDKASGECGKHPSTHITNLIQNWRAIGRRPKRFLYHWGVKILLPVTPLVYLVIKYITLGISAVEVALFVAISSFLFTVLDKIFETWLNKVLYTRKEPDILYAEFSWLCLEPLHKSYTHRYMWLSSSIWWYLICIVITISRSLLQTYISRTGQE